jgi:hypothetical protein
MDPVQEFKYIYHKLGLTFDSKIENKILEFAVPKNTPNQENIDPFSINRNAHSNLSIWRKRLSMDEINKIRTEAENISSNFYTDQDWN